MVSGQPILLIVAADARETTAIPQFLNGVRAVAVAGGAGRTNAARVVRKACEEMTVGAILSTGWCGALSAPLRVGDIVVADRVFSMEPEEQYQADTPEGGPAIRGAVLTVDHFVGTPDEKQRYRATGAVAVEMEAAGVAAEARRRGLPFFCVRAVSDDVDASFDLDFNRTRRPDGTFSPYLVARQAGWHPSRWMELLRLWRGSKRATEALGAYLGSCRFEW